MLHQQHEARDAGRRTESERHAGHEVGSERRTEQQQRERHQQAGLHVAAPART